MWQLVSFIEGITNDIAQWGKIIQSYVNSFSENLIDHSMSIQPSSLPSGHIDDTTTECDGSEIRATKGMGCQFKSNTKLKLMRLSTSFSGVSFHESIQRHPSIFWSLLHPVIGVFFVHVHFLFHYFELPWSTHYLSWIVICSLVLCI